MLVLAMAAVWLAGCGTSHDAGGVDAGGEGASVVDASQPSDDSTFGATDSGTAGNLTVVPSTTTLVVSDLSSLPSMSFAARVTAPDGSTLRVGASWSIDRLDVATIGAGDGVVTAAGTAFGAATVTASAFGMTARATIIVSLKTSVLATPVSPADQASLAAASATDPSVSALAYPYDQTVFPLGLAAPELMWVGGGPGDRYLVRISAPNLDLSVFTSAEPPSRYILPRPLWDLATATAAGGKMQVSLSRLAGASAYASAHESWTIANANLRGYIYYWSIADGAILKLDLTTGSSGPAFDPGSALTLGAPTPLDAGSPATPPWEDAVADHHRCVACHAVSKDGNTLGAVFSRADSTGPFGFVDVASARVASIGNYAVNGAFEALTPDGKYAVVNDNSMTLALADTSTGSVLASLFDGQQNLCDPVFSPDGTRFALATSCGLDDPLAYPVQYKTSNLSLFDFTESPAPAFSNARALVVGGSSEAGVPDAIAFPSFSPDSQWVFYQRGSNSRAKINFAMPYTHGADDLFVTAAHPAGGQIALDRANGAGLLSADNLHLNYAPTVNPIAEGGYIWVVFTSPRDYGNRLGATRAVGATAYPRDATYANNKQLWVTAVNADIQTTDPSHPAFWLPGQSTDSINMFGYWSLAPCKPIRDDAGAAATCNAGYECCSGFCRGGACTDPPGGCHQLGEACGSSADCCASGLVTCAGGVCQEQAPR